MENKKAHSFAFTSYGLDVKLRKSVTFLINMGP
jgi:hypothetical protein